MKKFLSITAVVALIAVMAVAMVGCVNVPQDPKEAEANLKENGYTAIHAQTALIMDTALSLVNACFPADDLDFKSGDLDSIVAGIKITSGEDAQTDFILALYFKEEDKAKAIETEVKNVISEMKEEMESFYEEKLEGNLTEEQKEEIQKQYDAAKEQLKQYAVGRSGVALVVGTKNGVNAAN